MINKNFGFWVCEEHVRDVIRIEKLKAEQIFRPIQKSTEDTERQAETKRKGFSFSLRPLLAITLRYYSINYLL